MAAARWPVRLAVVGSGTATQPYCTVTVTGGTYGFDVSGRQYAYEFSAFRV